VCCAATGFQDTTGSIALLPGSVLDVLQRRLLAARRHAGGGMLFGAPLGRGGDISISTYGG